MWLYLPLVFSAVFGLTAPRLARRLPPHVSTWMLSGGALVAAASSSSALALAAFNVLARNPEIAARGRWSDEVLRRHDPVTAPAGMLAIAAVVIFAARFLSAGTRRTSAILAAHRLAAHLPATGSELSVLQSARRQAFAVPGRPGRIAITTAMVRTLDSGQRRALLAHERSHLHHHHHLHHTAVHLAVAVNPLLRRLHAAVETATERWADEDATAVCHRDTVAAALTRAATGTSPPVPAVVLAAAASDIMTRVAALRAPAPHVTIWRIGLPSTLLMATVIPVAIAMRDTERLFELAHDAYRSTRP